jgi:hypothetical protein
MWYSCPEMCQKIILWKNNDNFIIPNANHKNIKIMKIFRNMAIALAVVTVISGCSGKQAEDKQNVFNERSSEATETDYDEAEYSAAEEKTPSLAGKTSQKDQTSSDQGLEYVISSSAATDNPNIDENRKIIRRADLQFRVQNVAAATYSVENIAVKFGGWVSYSNLFSQELSREQIKVSEDSSLVLSRYVVRNSIIIRTPYTSLDTTLKSLVPLIEYLDYRVINAEDVTFNLMAEKLKQKRLDEYNARMQKHTVEKPAKLQDLTEAERQILQQKERADEAYLKEMKLMDDIMYSIITIEMYETEKTEQYLIANPEILHKFKPGFGTRLLSSLKTGWIIIQEVILAVMNLWSLILLGFGVYFLVRFIIRKFSGKTKK